VAATEETKVKKAVLGRLKAVPFCYAYSSPVSMYGKSGIADIIAIIDGNYIAIECKTPLAYRSKNHGCTKNQLTFQEHVQDACGQYWVISCLTDLEQHLDRIISTD